MLGNNIALLPLFLSCRAAVGGGGMRDVAIQEQIQQALPDIAKHHVLWNAGGIGDHRRHVVPAHVPAPIHLRAHRGRVEPANHLVRQVQVAEISR
jgi:hypothetical protein